MRRSTRVPILPNGSVNFHPHADPRFNPSPRKAEPSQKCLGPAWQFWQVVLGMMRTRRVRNRGFTWIEVLISVFVIGITAAVYGSLVPMSIKTQTMAANHQQALGIVQHKVDQLRAVGYGRLTFTELKDAGIIDTTPTASPFRFDTVDNLDSLYISSIGTITVTDFSTTIRQVTVTLTWSGSGRRQGNGTLSLSALVAKG